MTESKSEILQGTLDLLVLKTLETMGSTHGWGIAKRIEQVSEDALSLNQGTLYPALVRLQQKGWIASAWGYIREQPSRQVLFTHIQGPSSTRGRNGELGANGGHHWEIAADPLRRSLSAWTGLGCLLIVLPPS